MKTPFALYGSTRQLRALTCHTATLTHELSAKKRQLQKVLGEQQVSPDQIIEGHRLVLGYLQRHIFWLEMTIAAFEKQIDKIVAEGSVQDDQADNLPKKYYADKALLRKLLAETGMNRPDY